jgi:hypothetical protein
LRGVEAVLAALLEENGDLDTFVYAYLKNRTAA